MKTRLHVVSIVLACAACQQQPSEPPADEEALDGALVTPGTGEDAPLARAEFDSVAMIDCTINGIEPVEGCEAGVARNRGENSTTLIEVTKPDGFTRTIYFDASGEPAGVTGGEADGSADWGFSASRQGDTYLVEYGPELYEVPEELVAGG